MNIIHLPYNYQCEVMNYIESVSKLLGVELKFHKLYPMGVYSETLYVEAPDEFVYRLLSTPSLQEFSTLWFTPLSGGKSRYEPDLEDKLNCAFVAYLYDQCITIYENTK